MLPLAILAAYTTAMVVLVCVAGWHPRRPLGTMAPMGEQACPGPCNWRWREAMDAWRQAAAEYERSGRLDSAQSRPEPPATVPWPGEPVWCGTCASKIRQALAELDDLIALLKATADGHRPATVAEWTSGSGYDHSASPAFNAEEDAAAMLTGWESAYRDLHGWPSPARRGELASTETTCVAWLMQHLDGILRSPPAADFGREVLNWHRELTGMSKAGVQVERKPLRCPACRWLTLDWTVGEDYVYCANKGCNLVMRYQEYEAEVSRLAEQEGRVRA